MRSSYADQKPGPRDDSLELQMAEATNSYKVTHYPAGPTGPVRESLQLGWEQKSEQDKLGTQGDLCFWTPATLPIGANSSTAGISKRQIEEVQMQLEKNHTEPQKLFMRNSHWDVLELGVGGWGCTSERQKPKSKVQGRIQKRGSFSTQRARCELMYWQWDQSPSQSFIEPLN